MILVTGNLGYIGTVMVGMLRENSYHVVGLDTGFYKKSCFYPLSEEYHPHQQITQDVRKVERKDYLRHPPEEMQRP